MRILVIFLHIICATIPLFSANRSPETDKSTFPGWPRQFHGQELVQVHLSNQEKRFVEGFPGKVARFSTESDEIIIRWVTYPSRKLHPASDCYKGSGYTIEPRPIQVDHVGEHWGCFLATRNRERLEVCEKISDQLGQSWSDVSSWFWSALLGKSTGPWWAVTIAKDLSYESSV